MSVDPLDLTTVESIVRAITERPGESSLVRVGVVTAVTDPTVTVRLGGGAVDIPGVRRLATYTPAVNHTVALLQTGPELLVLGNIA